ncbi:MAG: cyclic nucleotide-binding domain-containing protein [Gammaproteobacteria bacterium]|nr:MAG: cyclic nucleotide-binding domain-containing protein [Gammaproteobacteria bacterium]
MRPGGFQTGDVWGGIAAAAVVLPQAMAFGVALLTVAGFSAGTGALVGLIGAAAVSLVSGIAGGTRGLISAPTGPMLVLQVAALASLSKAGLSGDALLTSLAAVLLTTGILQFLIGISGGGRLIKFLPYPVVAGFITGSGILMILSQIKPLSTEVSDVAWAQWQSLPIATAAVTFLAMSAVPQYLPKIPGTIAGLVVGTVFFQVMILFGPASAPSEWVIGSLPGMSSMGSSLQLDAIPQIPWKIVVPSAMALAVLSSIDTLLTSVIADVETRVRHSAKRELIGQGFGQMLAGLTGGMAGAGTTGATLVSVRSGGRRWVAVITGLIFILLIIVGGSVGQVLPISVLAGVILHVALSMLDRDVLAWLRNKNARMDAGIALLVTGVTVVYDLMIAVGVGVVIAAVMFIRNEVKAAVIHRRSNVSEVHSVKARLVEERKLLDENAERIVLYELRGNLFFATADRLFEELSADLERDVYLVLHMRRVRQVDLSAIKILQQIAERLHASGGHLMFCEVHSGLGIGRKMHKILRKVSPAASKWKIRTFIGADEALSWAEDSLLESLGVQAFDYKRVAELANTDLCADMNHEDVETIARITKEKFVAKDETLFSRGDYGDELFIVLSGQIDVRLPTTKKHYTRLRAYGPGSAFGEIGFFDPGQRTADAVAIHDTRLLILDREGMDEMSDCCPKVAVALLKTLGRFQGQHLRWSAREIRRLSQW